MAGVNLFDGDKPSRLCKQSLLDMFKLVLVSATINTPAIVELREKFNFVLPIEVENNGGEVMERTGDTIGATAVQDIAKVPAEEELTMTHQPCPGERSYHALKQFSTEYFRVKKSFFATLYNTGLGSWTSNCADCDMFDLKE